VKKLRNYIFLKDILLLALTAFGGPQAHIAMFLDILVVKRGYLTEAELIELNALCQILPGPTSTQTLMAVGYKRGGTYLAFWTLLVWILPATILMTAAAIGLAYIQKQEISLDFSVNEDIVKYDKKVKNTVSSINHPSSWLEVRAERSFLNGLGGGCQLPIAAYGKRHGDELILMGLVGGLDGRVMIRETVIGRMEDGEALGKNLAENILSRGGRAILESVISRKS